MRVRGIELQESEWQIRWLRFRSWLTLPRGIGLITIALGFVHYLPLPALPIPWLIDLHDDIASELIGIGITVILIDWAVTRQAKIERKAQLIRQLGSRYRDVTEMARVELEHEGWLYDGSLSGANLRIANLSGADLWQANLSGADLAYADLTYAAVEGANLRGANLQDADLNNTNLTGSDLSDVNLQNTNMSESSLWDVKLQGADLRGASLWDVYMRGADLSGADLREANLSGANLREANLSGAYLPRDLVINPNKWSAVIIERRTLRWSRDAS